jgi:hypothetical protein
VWLCVCVWFCVCVFVVCVITGCLCLCYNWLSALVPRAWHEPKHTCRERARARAREKERENERDRERERKEREERERARARTHTHTNTHTRCCRWSTWEPLTRTNSSSCCNIHTYIPVCTQVLPLEYLEPFHEHELELLLCGSSVVDVQAKNKSQKSVP